VIGFFHGFNIKIAGETLVGEEALMNLGLPACQTKEGRSLGELLVSAEEKVFDGFNGPVMQKPLESRK
jgi:hypothetical protein